MRPYTIKDEKRLKKPRNRLNKGQKCVGSAVTLNVNQAVEYNNT